jgi:phage tail-like protein
VTSEATRSGSYLQLLPAIYSDEGEFLGTFLRVFEQVLTGLSEQQRPAGLEQAIAGIAQLFDPLRQGDYLDTLAATPQARKEFLAWLSGWVALSLRADWGEEKQRAFLAQAALLYRLRGTKGALAALLQTYTGQLAEITEGDALPGKARGTPHHFHVILYLNADQAELNRIAAIARELIELQKPAHTTYDLEFETRTLQIRTDATYKDGQRTAVVGVDTTLTRFEK